MDAALEAQLIECLSALDNGEAIERILARYPEAAGRLRPMLETAAALPALRREPSQAARAESRAAFLAQAGALAGKPAPRRAALFARPLMSLVSLALAVIVLGGGALAASANALPGDPLYGLKRAVESARLSLASDSAARGSLAAQFERERLDEIAALLAAGREAEVEFSGVIESIQPNAWLVSNLAVHVNDNTRISGDPQVGRRAQLRGRTLDGMLIATSIAVEEGSGPAPQPSPTAEPEATGTPEPERTPTPSPTPALTATPSPTPTATRTPAPTARPTPFEVEFTGQVDHIDGQTWTISGLAVRVNPNTEYRNNPGLGSRVRVRVLNTGGDLLALRIERLQDDGNDGNTNANENENGNENDGGNANENENENDNDNHNENENDNGNDNENHNENDNTNG